MLAASIPRMFPAGILTACRLSTLLSKELGLNRNELDPLTLRRKCHDFALQWVDIQREDFKRLGVLGDWEKSVHPLHHSFEAEQIRVFGTMANKKAISTR